MVRGRPNAVAILSAFLVGGAGCGGSGEGDAPSPPGASVSCTADPRLDSYSGEIDKAGEIGRLRFRFFDLEPSPPAKGSNTFHVQVSNTGGELMQGDLRVDLRMPDHGHGTSVEPVISLDPALGTYTVTPLFLFMPGVWRLEFECFDSSSNGAAPLGESMIDSVVLHFCIEG